MVTTEQLQEWRDRLLDARYDGIRRVRDSDGSEIEYRSDGELARAIADVERRINGAGTSTIRFRTSKGL